MRTHEDILAARGDVEARVLGGSRGIGDALGLLDAAETATGAPLVDESERARLQRLATAESDRVDHWHSLLARRAGEPVGYAGIVLDGEGASDRDGEPLTAVADVVVAPDARPCEPVLSVLLTGIEALGWDHGVRRVVVWIRHATPADLACGVDHGYGVDRRLGVLGCAMEEAPTSPEVPAGHRLRSFESDRDADRVVALLRAAYAGTPDSGWSRERLDERRGYEWFRPDDLLVLEAGDELLGLHWTKRRGDGRGEVYNLAVHPDAQGSGLGAVLLRAGVAHLWDVGCRDVLLWVDLANERAVRLYTSHGFRTRWEDLALSRSLRRPPRRSPRRPGPRSPRGAPTRHPDRPPRRRPRRPGGD